MQSADRSPPLTRREVVILIATALVSAAVVAGFEGSGLFADDSPEVRAAVVSPPWDRWTRMIENRAHRTIFDFRIALAVAAPGVALAAFRRPGDLDRRAWQRPGVLALAAATIVEVIDVGPDAIMAAYVGIRFIFYKGLYFAPNPSREVFAALFRNLLNFSPDPAGVVLGAWTVLAISGNWRPSHDWRDRVGRWFGWSWLLAYGLRIVDPVIWGLP